MALIDCLFDANMECSIKLRIGRLCFHGIHASIRDVGIRMKINQYIGLSSDASLHRAIS